jgi:type I restriction enzyme M protein
MALSLNKPKLDNLAGDIWKSAERLRGKFKAYEYQNVILPIIVIRRLECVLIAWREQKRAGVLANIEPYEKSFTAANLKKELEFYESELTFLVRVKADGEDKTLELALKPGNDTAKKFKVVFEDRPEIVSVDWMHRHYVQDDEYIPHGEDIEAFLKREIAKPIIRWEETRKDGKTILGYEILPNKYFYRYQPPTPSKELLTEFWRLEKDAEKMLEELADPQ